MPKKEVDYWSAGFFLANQSFKYDEIDAIWRTRTWGSRASKQRPFQTPFFNPEKF